MKKFALLLSILLILGGTAYYVNAENSKSVTKYLTYEQAIEQNKPAIILFESRDCSFCVKFAPVYKRLSKEFGSKFAFSQVDVNERKYSRLCNKLEIYTIPKIFVYEPNSKTLQPIPQPYYHETTLRKILTDFQG